MQWTWKPTKRPRRTKYRESKAEEGVIWKPMRIRGGKLSTRMSEGATVGEILRESLHKCAFCKGAGEVRMGTKCPVCKGRGESMIKPPAVRCAFCKGRGEDKPRSNVTCLACKGKGIIPVVEPIEGCSQCRGVGHEPGNSSLSCGRCRGKGVVTIKESHDDTQGVKRFIRRPGGSELEAAKVVYELGEASRVDIGARIRVSSAYADYICKSMVGKGYLERVSRDLYILTPECEKAMEEEEKKELEKVTPDEKEILRLIEEEEGESTVSQIRDEVELGFDRVNKICDSLGKRDFIDLFASGKVRLTPKGEKALKNQSKDWSKDY